MVPAGRRDLAGGGGHRGRRGAGHGPAARGRAAGPGGHRGARQRGTGGRQAGGGVVPDRLGCGADPALLDHHCHGVVLRDVAEADLESMLNEGAGWPGGSVFDSAAGFAFRRLCPPVLGLPPHAGLPEDVTRRAELGAAEVSKRFLAGTGTSVMCVDTGFTPEPITSPAELADLAGATAHEIVRLERVAEDVAAAGGGGAGFAGAGPAGPGSPPAP